MPFTFSVYSKDTPLARQLANELSKISSTVLVSSLGDLANQEVQNVIAISPFHASDLPKKYKKCAQVFIYKNISEFKPLAGSFFVHEDSNLAEAVKTIVKVFCGFGSAPIVISPLASDEIVGVDFVLVGKAEARHEVKSTPTTLAETPKEAKPLSTKTQTSSHVNTPKVRKINIRIPKLPRSKFKMIGLGGVVFLIWLLSLPYLFLVIAGGCAFVSTKNVAPGAFLSCSKTMSSFSGSIGVQLSNIQPLSALYRTPVELSSFSYEASNIGLGALNIYKKIGSMPSAQAVSSVSPEISKLVRDFSYLQANTTAIQFLGYLSPSIQEIIKNSSQLNLLSVVANNTNSLLGVGKPASYLVLLQNNMELRPAGGFIGSFMLVEVSNAKVTAKDVYDVYDADGQLNGYVKPPQPIVDYLGEASWHMRDSNWSPDFLESARRAEWFLEKSMNKNVNGVVAIDLEVLKTFVSAVGPIKVNDYGGELTAENFYETIQNEVHKEFFPGSRKKSNYLTAVFNSVLQKMEGIGSGQAIKLLAGLTTNVKARDIQVYLNDEALENEVKKAGLAGEIPQNSFGFVEANVGVNKANQFIERKGSYRIEKDVQEGSVTQTLEVTNRAGSASDETRYRVYVRALAPVEATLGSIKVISGGLEQPVIATSEKFDNRQEVGAFVEVKAGERAFVTVNWTIPPMSFVNLWKQSGVSGYPVSIETLTSMGERQYNTTLGQDYLIQL